MAQMPALVSAAVSFWEDIDEQVLGAPAAAVTFSGIDTTFTFFKLTSYLIAVAGGDLRLDLRFNNDAGVNYTSQMIRASGAGTSGSRIAASSSIPLTPFDDINAAESGLSVILAAKPIAGEEAQVIASLGYDEATSNAIGLILEGGQWNNVVALISRIDFIQTLGNNFDTGTRILLEGGKPV